MREIVIGVFHRSTAARRALEDLCDAGFSGAYVGLLAHDHGRAAAGTPDPAGTPAESSAASPAGARGEPLFTRQPAEGMNGFLDAAGLGAARPRAWAHGEPGPISARSWAAMDAGMDDDEYGLPWALDVVEGALPGIGAVVVGGVLGGVLDAGENGVAGALAELGVTKAEAAYYQKLFAQGRTIVVVDACSHARLVLSILGRYRAFERTLFRVPGEDPTPPYASEGSGLA